MSLVKFLKKIHESRYSEYLNGKLKGLFGLEKSFLGCLCRRLCLSDIVGTTTTTASCASATLASLLHRSAALFHGRVFATSSGRHCVPVIPALFSTWHCLFGGLILELWFFIGETGIRTIALVEETLLLGLVRGALLGDFVLLHIIVKGNVHSEALLWSLDLWFVGNTIKSFIYFFTQKNERNKRQSPAQI